MGSQEEGRNGMLPPCCLLSKQISGTWQSSRPLIMSNHPASLAWGSKIP